MFELQKKMQRHTVISDKASRFPVNSDSFKEDVHRRNFDRGIEHDVRIVQKLRYSIDKVPDTEGDEIFWDTRRKKYYSGMKEIPPSQSTALAILNRIIENARVTSEAISSFSSEQNKYVADGLKKGVLLEFDEDHFVEANKDSPKLYNGGQVHEYMDHEGYAEYRSMDYALGTAGTFGTELEMVGIPWDNNDMSIDLSKNLGNNKYGGWKTEIDATVHEQKDQEIVMGLELVSPILEDKKEAWESIATVYEVIKNYGGKYNSTCSGHIHFGVDALEGKEDSWDNLFLLYRAAQDVIAIIAQSGQKELRGAIKGNAPPFKDFSPDLLEENTPVSKQENTSVPKQEGAQVKSNLEVIDEYKKLVPANLKQIYERTTGREWKGDIDADRHSPLNIFSLFTKGDKKKPTVEFRVFNFPETKEALQANVFLSNAIVQAAKKPKEDVRVFLKVFSKKKELEERAMYLFDFITENKEDYLLLWKAFRYNQAKK